MARNLLHCSFCGGDVSERQIVGGFLVMRCGDCGADGLGYEAGREAVGVWNRRNAPDIATTTRQAEDARAMHLASVTTLIGLIEALAPLVKLDPEGEVGEWAEKIERKVAEIEAGRNQAREDLKSERARSDGFRRALALASDAPDGEDTIWDDLIGHVCDLRPPSDPPALTEAEMEARAAAWEERAERIHRIEALRPDVTLDPMVAEEREAAIERHRLRIAELERLALTGVR